MVTNIAEIIFFLNTTSETFHSLRSPYYEIEVSLILFWKVSVITELHCNQPYASGMIIVLLYYFTIF